MFYIHVQVHSYRLLFLDVFLSYQEKWHCLTLPPGLLRHLAWKPTCPATRAMAKKSWNWSTMVALRCPSWLLMLTDHPTFTSMMAGSWQQARHKVSRTVLFLKTFAVHTKYLCSKLCVFGLYSMLAYKKPCMSNCFQSLRQGIWSYTHAPKTLTGSFCFHLPVNSRPVL